MKISDEQRVVSQSPGIQSGFLIGEPTFIRALVMLHALTITLIARIKGRGLSCRA